MKKLSEYNKKRDFKKTKEPKGASIRKKSKKLIFVVQEHHARRLHYDFRLELDGVLKSWAVPKGPSLDPKDKRLAVQTEDHPLEYAKFHGTIPQGEYGGGEVFIWDKGTWESEMEDPEAAIEKGELKFKLKGKKLNGSFVLVRTNWKGSGEKKNWLLIKHKEEVAEKPSKKKIAKKKSTLGKDPWPDFIKPQLPRLISEVPVDRNWLYEMKLDGYRMQGHIQNGVANFYTRSGLNWSGSFPHLLNGLSKLGVTNAIIDGEIVAFDEEGKTNFQNLQNSIKGKDDKKLIYYAFDLLFLNGQDLRSLPLIERKEMLQNLLKGAPKNISYCEHILEKGKDFFEVSCQHELEGIIGKMQDAPYSSGRNDLWVKVKCSLRQEFVIGGWTEPKGARSGLGALLVGYYEKGKFKYSGRVGTGFSHQILKDLKKSLTEIETEESPFDLRSPRGRDIHWAEPKLVAEVAFANWTNEGVLRAAVFHGLREDKPTKEIHMDKPKLKLVKDISSPDKVLFPKDKKTKEDVAKFYQKVAPAMLPYMADRPLTLVRCPNGAKGTCFYQKHINGKVPASLDAFPVKESSGEEGLYVALDSVEGLMELVQLNAFEIHSWGSHKDTYKRPDQIVMDLDPGPGVSWSEVVDGAIELKNLLLDLELDSFVKVTGGKGIHVHIPIAPLYNWDQVKSFSETLAREMVNRNPEKYTANMSKKVRRKKIFIDYLRNGFGATAVVPYSLRAKESSSVAMPVEWKELKRLKGGDAFSMDQALRKIKSRKRDPWEGMLDMEQEIMILKPMKALAA